MHTQFRLKSPKGRDNSVDLGVNRKITIKWTLQSGFEKYGLDLCDSE
jgi:hypothetical protein